MRAKIQVNYNGETFVTEFSIERDTPEYIIADEAYRVALLFAEIRVLATTGHPVDCSELGAILQQLDYTYSIEEA